MSQNNLAEKTELVKDATPENDPWALVIEGLGKLQAALAGRYCREHDEAYKEGDACESCVRWVYEQEHNEFVGCAEEDRL